MVQSSAPPHPNHHPTKDPKVDSPILVCCDVTWVFKAVVSAVSDVTWLAKRPTSASSAPMDKSSLRFCTSAVTVIPTQISKETTVSYFIAVGQTSDNDAT